MQYECQLFSYVQKVATEIAGTYVISSPHDAWMTRNIYRSSALYKQKGDFVNPFIWVTVWLLDSVARAP